MGRKQKSFRGSFLPPSSQTCRVSLSIEAEKHFEQRFDDLESSTKRIEDTMRSMTEFLEKKQSTRVALHMLDLDFEYIHE